MSTRIIIALCAAVAILTFLQIRSCRQAPSHAVEAQTQDSMMHLVADSIRHLQAREDSLIIRKKDRVIDSLVPLANAAKSAVNEKGRQMVGTIAAGREARVRHDTIRILTNCDSLIEEADAGVHLVGGYEYLTDSLLSALQLQRKVQDSLSEIHRKEKQLLLAALDSSNARYQHLYKDYTPLQKTSGKRWSVGPGGGAMLMGGQIKGSVGLTAHYDLFKF